MGAAERVFVTNGNEVCSQCKAHLALLVEERRTQE